MSAKKKQLTITNILTSFFNNMNNKGIDGYSTPILSGTFGPSNSRNPRGPQYRGTIIAHGMTNQLGGPDTKFYLAIWDKTSKYGEFQSFEICKAPKQLAQAVEPEEFNDDIPF